MARTRTTVTEEIPEEEATRLTALELDQDSTFSEILSELNAAPEDVTYTGTVHEVPVRPDGTAMKGTKEIFLFDIDQSQFGGLNEYLRDQCGTGTYRVRVKRNGVLVKNTTLRVKKIGLPMPSQSGETTALSGIVDRLLTRMEAMENRIAATPSQTPLDPFAAMEKMSVVFSNLKPAPAPEPAKNDIKETLALVTAILTISKEVGGGGDGGTMWDMLGKILPGAIENAGKILPQMAPPNAGNQPATQSLPTPENQSQNQSQNRQDPQAQLRQEIESGAAKLGISPPQFARLRETIIILCRRARSKNDPKGYVDFVLDELDDISEAMQLPFPLAPTLLKQDDILATLKTAFPVMVPHEAWFSELFDACREAIEGDNGSDGIAACDTGETAGFRPRNLKDHASACEGREA